MDIVENHLSALEYTEMRKAFGLSEKSVEAAEIALPNSLYSISFYQDYRHTAMGRVVGDGACFVQVVDVCVHPEFQGQGLGKAIMKNITEYLMKLPKTCYASLIADGEAAALYEKFGFKNVGPHAAGMYLKIL